MTDAHTHYTPTDRLYIYNIRYTSVVPAPPMPANFSIGIHPYDAHLSINWPLFESIAPNASAIGECGLDRNARAPLDLQIEIFSRQLRLAHQLHKPIIIHCVKAYGHLLSVLQSNSTIPMPYDSPMIIHGIYSSLEWLRSSLKYNFYYSIGPAQLRLPRTLDLLKAIPPSRLLLESDESQVDYANFRTQVATILANPNIISQTDLNFHTLFPQAAQ